MTDLQVGTEALDHQIDRIQKIKELETELKGISETLQVSMERAMLTLAERQREMDRWCKLAKASGRVLHVSVQTESSSTPTFMTKENTVLRNTSALVQDSKENRPEEEESKQNEEQTKNNVDLSNTPKRLEITASGFLQETESVAHSIQSVPVGFPTANESFTEDDNELNISSASTSKLERLRLQEDKVRSLLSNLKCEESTSVGGLNDVSFTTTSSSEFSAKLERRQQQENKVRSLLSHMQETIHPVTSQDAVVVVATAMDDEETPKKKGREPTINECLGLTEFFIEEK